jgi:hypothetical protein
MSLAELYSLDNLSEDRLFSSMSLTELNPLYNPSKDRSFSDMSLTELYSFDNPSKDRLFSNMSLTELFSLHNPSEDRSCFCGFFPFFSSLAINSSVVLLVPLDLFLNYILLTTLLKTIHSVACP